MLRQASSLPSRILLVMFALIALGAPAAAQATKVVNLSVACVNRLQVDINGGAAPGASVTSISWNWGDGATTTAFFPQSHTYAAQGQYMVQVTAHYTDGSTASSSETVNVAPGVLSNCVALTITAGPGGSVSYQASVGSDMVLAGSSKILELDFADDLFLTAKPSSGNSFSNWSASAGITGTGGSAINSTSSFIDIVVANTSQISAAFSSLPIPVFAPPTQPSYDITFTETGLPSNNTNWLVTFNGRQYSSSMSSIVFSAPNGGYSYVIHSVGGYMASPSSGSISVNGASVNQPVQYASSCTLCIIAPPLKFVSGEGTVASNLYINYLGSGSLTVSLQCKTPTGQACRSNFISAGQIPSAPLTGGTANLYCPDSSPACFPVELKTNTSTGCSILGVGCPTSGIYNVNVVVIDSNGERATSHFQIDLVGSTVSVSIPNVDLGVKLQPLGSNFFNLVVTLEPQGNDAPASYVIFDDSQMQNFVNGILNSLKNANFTVPSSSSQSVGISVVPVDHESEEIGLAAGLVQFLLTAPQSVQELVSAVATLDVPTVVLTAAQVAYDEGLLNLCPASSTSPCLLGSYSPPQIVGEILSSVLNSLSSGQERLLYYSAGCNQSVHTYLGGTQYFPKYAAGKDQQIVVNIAVISLPPGSQPPTSLSLSGQFAWYPGARIGVSQCGAGNGVCTYEGKFSNIQVNLAQCLAAAVGIGCDLYATYVGTTILNDPESPFIVLSGQGLRFSGSRFNSSTSAVSTNASVNSTRGLSAYPLSILVPFLYDQNRSTDFALTLDGIPVPFTTAQNTEGYILTANLQSGGNVKLVTTQQPPEIGIGVSAGSIYIIGTGFVPGSNVQLGYFNGTQWVNLTSAQADSSGSFLAFSPFPVLSSNYLVISALDNTRDRAITQIEASRGVHLVTSLQSIAFDDPRDQYIATVTVTNNGITDANSVSLNFAELNAAPTSTALPVNIGNLGYAASAAITLAFPVHDRPDERDGRLEIRERYAGGSAEEVIRVKLPRRNDRDDEDDEQDEHK